MANIESPSASNAVQTPGTTIISNPTIGTGYSYFLQTRLDGQTTALRAVFIAYESPF